MTSEPRRVENRFWAISTTSNSSLFGHHDHAGKEAAWITRSGPVSTDRVDESDEVADDESRIAVRHGIVRVKPWVVRRGSRLAWVFEAAPIPCVPRYIEMSKAGHRDGSGRTVDVREGAVRRDVGVQDSGIPTRKAVVHSVGHEHVPVVVPVAIDERAGVGTLIAPIKTRVEPSGDVIGLPPGVHRDARPGDRAPPERSSSDRRAIGRPGIRNVGRAAALLELSLQIG